MKISVGLAKYFCFLFWMTEGFGSFANAKTRINYVPVKLGGSVTINCTYNCSGGFIRGHWKKASEVHACHTTTNVSVCTVSLCLSNISTEDLKKNFTCYTEDKEDPQLRKKIVHIIGLKLHGEKHGPKWAISPNTHPKNATLSPVPEDSSGGEFNGIKVLAAVTVSVAVVLAALSLYLCLNRNRQIWNGKEEPVVPRTCSPKPPDVSPLPLKGTLSKQSEKITLHIPPPDPEDDSEVPYADIMITIRGVSTPELTQVGYLSTGEWRGDESRCPLQAFRSADRLHVPHPREVSRKMSTSSEYAVITYA